MNSPVLSRLAAYQKRIHDWREFNKSEVQDPAIKARTDQLISDLSELLMKCWDNNSITGENEFAIQDLERQLEQLNEEARVRVIGKKSASSLHSGTR